MYTRNLPHGISPHFRAPYSGQPSVGQIEASLATLPGSVAQLKEAWESIGESRLSGLSPNFQGGPLDDAVREGEWVPELQQNMPTMGGFPGSRGVIQAWPYEFCEDAIFDSGLEAVKTLKVPDLNEIDTMKGDFVTFKGASHMTASVILASAALATMTLY